MLPILLSVPEMIAAEKQAIAAGHEEEALMEEAGKGIAEIMMRRFATEKPHAILFAGKGHNAGDGFVVAKHLIDAGWSMETRLTFPPEEMRPLTRKKWELIATSSMNQKGRGLVLIDALLGLGSEGTLVGKIQEAAREMNSLRQTEFAETIALDGPTGLSMQSGTADPDAILADLTITIGFPKVGLVTDNATKYVGRLEIVTLKSLVAPRTTGDQVLTTELLRTWLPPKAHFDTHKGNSGRVSLIAGSIGYVGATRLCATAAAEAGAGLVTLYVPENIYPIAAAACPPEVMVQSFDQLGNLRADAVGIGPGLGSVPQPELLELVKHFPGPVLLDADSLNWLSAEKALSQFLGSAKFPRLFTPHPGEMARLVPDWSGMSRAELARKFADYYATNLLLKGARSVISAPDRPLSYNTTGHPGMASGGMGDVLTGMGTALLAKGIPAYESACLASWILGRSAEIAIHKASAPFTSAQSVAAELAATIQFLRTGGN